MAKNAAGALKKFKEEYLGFIYVLPVIAGILIFTLVPMAQSLWYSLHDYKLNVGRVENFGFQNYIKMFTEDFPSVSGSLLSTFKYALVSVPLFMVLSFSLALFVNRERGGIRLFRTLYYLPCVIPSIVSGLLWRQITDVETGYVNMMLKSAGISPSTWFSANETAFGSFLFVMSFTIGGNMILWLSQFKQIPRSIYESADMDGAGAFTKLFKLTVPMCSPIIFFTLITGIIGTLQTFDLAFVFQNALNANTLNFIGVYIYNIGIGRLDMGYASTLSWFLFFIIALLSMLIFKHSKWVYYGESND